MYYSTRPAFRPISFLALIGGMRLPEMGRRLLTAVCGLRALGGARPRELSYLLSVIGRKLRPRGSSDPRYPRHRRWQKSEKAEMGMEPWRDGYVGIREQGSSTFVPITVTDMHLLLQPIQWLKIGFFVILYFGSEAWCFLQDKWSHKGFSR
jgi:hypothetical protein